ncbi:MAG TPA: hypothetical protein VMU19_00745 [Bryobacteraceae bacterium]|nr:hypothetical protein [Bryobacteraceae bacterium]
MFRRSILACALVAWSGLAAPPLTTIQDILYKADGTRFNGTVTVSWTSFQASDQSAIQTQSTTVKIVDGNLRVQLVPTANASPAAYYTARYNSDGRVQFEETWSVPVSAATVRLRDVRVAAPAAGSSAPANDTGGSDVTLPIAETDVTGLVADLAARPVKGAGFAAGRVAVVDSLGVLESATGSATDCMHVDGSSGPCGGGAPSFVDADTLTGIVDGSNTSFTLSSTPNPAASLAVYRNGMLESAGVDYTASGNAIQFGAASAPQPGDTLLASYRMAGGAGGGTTQAYPALQVVCAGTGSSTSATSLASMGTCAIPGGLLAAGDRVEIRFDLEHQGSAGGFTFQVSWGGTTVVQRSGAAGDLMVSGRADAGILAAGAQVSQESWGSVLPQAAGVVNAADAWANGITISFQGQVAQASDAVGLGSFSVVRVP